MLQGPATLARRVERRLETIAAHPTFGWPVAMGLRHREKVLYLIVGGWNTLFGYLFWVVLQLLFYPQLSYLVTLAISWPVSILNAYICYRFIVFHSKGPWWKELPRFSLVYFVVLFLDLVILPLLLRVLPFNVYVCQAGFIFVVVAMSYLAHKYFSFGGASSGPALTADDASASASAAGAKAGASSLAHERSRRFERSLDAAYYLAAALVPFGIIAWMLDLWSFVLSAPIAYSGDALFYMAEVKGWFEHGSYYVNPSLGAPGVSQLYDFPSADAIDVLLLRVFGWFGASPGAAINLFYLIGYPLMGVVTAFVLRRLKLSRPVALAATVLYLFIPYHWMRGEGHLFLAMFWIVPLQLLVLWWTDSAEPPLFKPGGGYSLAPTSGRTIAAVAISLAAGACGIYYMFFGCFFLALVGARAALRDRTWRPVVVAAALVALSGGVFLVQMTPTLVYQHRNGPNPTAAARTSFEAEIYGLRITQMLLPIDSHRIPAMAAKREFYRVNSPGGGTEANTAALGVIGSVGFILALTVLLLGWPRDPGSDMGCEEERSRLPRLRWFATLLVGAVLLATVAGFGAVFAGAISPQIRAYNRISVYVALFAFIILGVLADRLLRNRSSTAGRTAVLAVVAAVAVLGVLDQTMPHMAATAQASAAAYATDAAFGQQVQSALTPGSMVFQLPYMAYPGSAPVNVLQDYEQLRGYLHTEGLLWSYGAMKGRPEATWEEETSALPPAAMVTKLRAAGFSALWVELTGYADGGKAMLEKFDALLGEPALVKPGGTVAVWRL